MRRFLLGETNRYGDTGKPMGEITHNRKRTRFSGIQHQNTYIKINNINHRQKMTGQTVEEKDSDAPTVVEQKQQKTYDRKNKKHNILEALKSNREKDIREEPLQKITHTGQYVTRAKERHKDRNCRYCDSAKWNTNHKCPARDVICHQSKKRPLLESMQT